jgi:hypothetical protein
MAGDDIMTVEATTSGFFEDPGAKCMDPVWGDISASIKTAGTVELVVPSTYRVEYTCTNPAPWSVSATKLRTVVVRDTTCPVCTLNGKHKISVEADFTLTDPGATCNDMISGQLSVEQTGNVNVRTVGEYKITYRAKDMAGNWNDGCGQAKTIRTVQVIDTLKPVIALSSPEGQYIHVSKGDDTSTADTSHGLANPAGSYFQKKIETWDNNRQAGAGPWLMPDAADWSNPRNLQPTEHACMEQCKKLQTCRFGTYMTDGQRKGECWLSAHAAPAAATCVGSCTGFEVKTQGLFRRRLMAAQNQASSVWLLGAGVVCTVGLALVALNKRPVSAVEPVEV